MESCANMEQPPHFWEVKITKSFIEISPKSQVDFSLFSRQNDV